MRIKKSSPCCFSAPFLPKHHKSDKNTLYDAVHVGNGSVIPFISQSLNMYFISTLVL